MRLIGGYEDGGWIRVVEEVGDGGGGGIGVLVIRLLASMSKHLSVCSLLGQNRCCGSEERYAPRTSLTPSMKFCLEARVRCVVSVDGVERR